MQGLPQQKVALRGGEFSIRGDQHILGGHPLYARVRGYRFRPDRSFGEGWSSAVLKKTFTLHTVIPDTLLDA
ncbi:MAG: hypothetical protein LUQ37_06400 [Methanoregulaceae archaeon]|nr:hypothetical protein [Methanoregulaceae archaeon]